MWLWLIKCFSCKNSVVPINLHALYIHLFLISPQFLLSFNMLDYVSFYILIQLKLAEKEWQPMWTAWVFIHAFTNLTIVFLIYLYWEIFLKFQIQLFLNIWNIKMIKNSNYVFSAKCKHFHIRSSGFTNI